MVSKVELRKPCIVKDEEERKLKQTYYEGKRITLGRDRKVNANRRQKEESEREGGG